jgi:type I restriction enzyme M protein
MSAEASRIVNKLWSYCNILRDDGLSYGDYLEQLSVLLFLKLAHEQTQPRGTRTSPVPEGYDWPSLNALDGVALEQHFRATLEHLGKQHGLLGLVFRKAQNKIQDPAKLKRLISDLIDREQWTLVDADIKGDAYEGLLSATPRTPSPARGNTSRRDRSSTPSSR